MKVLLPFLLASGLTAQQPAPADHQLAHDLLKELIEINTTDSSGDNTRAAEAVAARFRAAGFPSSDIQLLTPAERKGNLIVRYRGAGTAKPILFLGHLDVVEARRSDWTLDPFVLTEKDGYYYGRGTQDMKGDDALIVAAFLTLKRRGFQPAGDLILALTSDEEGGDHNGVQWLVANHRDLIDAAFCINADSGGGHIRDGKRVLYAVEGAEKVFNSFRFTTSNRGGHSSIPRKDNAIYELSEGLTRLAGYQFPVHLNPVTQGYFERMSVVETGQLADDFRAVSKSAPNLAATSRLSENPYYNALLRTTCVATELSGGHAENALPQRAQAIVNCRVLPNESQADTFAKLKEIAGPAVSVEPLRPEKPRVDVALSPGVLKIIKTTVDSMWPNLPLVPVMDTGASDGIFLEAAGMPVYGLSAMFGDENDVRAHGQDERIRVDWFNDGLDFELRLIQSLAESHE